MGTGLSLHPSPTPFTPKVAPETMAHLHLSVPPLNTLTVSLGNPNSTPRSLCLDALGGLPGRSVSIRLAIWLQVWPRLRFLARVVPPCGSESLQGQGALGSVQMVPRPPGEGQAGSGHAGGPAS